MKNSILSDNNLEGKILSYRFTTGLIINSNAMEIDSEIDDNTNRGIITRNSNKSLDRQIDNQLKKCLYTYEEIFCSTILDEYIEDGYISNSQKLYSKITEEYGISIAGMFLNEVYKKNATNGKIIKSLLFILGCIEPKYLRGAEEGILAYALNNRDYEIRDLALQCYEKWNDKKYLELLKSMDMGVKFLQEYLNDIIQQLEGE